MFSRNGSASVIRQPVQRSRFWAAVRGRCPRCCQGQIFKGRFEMNRTCPVCGLPFQKEAGYFLGAMYFSYPLSALVLGIFFAIGMYLLPNWGYEWVLALAMIPYL